MSKIEENLKDLDADQAMEKLGDYFEQYHRNLTDPAIGPLRTAFNIGAGLRETIGLKRAVAEKQGLNRDARLSEILAAVEARGSRAGIEKTRHYLDAIEKYEALAEAMGADHMNWVKQMYVKIRIAKALGFNPG